MRRLNPDFLTWLHPASSDRDEGAPALQFDSSQIRVLLYRQQRELAHRDDTDRPEQHAQVRPLARCQAIQHEDGILGFRRAHRSSALNVRGALGDHDLPHRPGGLRGGQRTQDEECHHRESHPRPSVSNDPPEEVPSQAVVGEASRRHPLAWSSAFGYHSSAGFWASAPAPAPSLTNSLRSLRDLGWVREAEDEGTYGDLDHAMTTLELNSFTQGYGRQGPHP